MKLTHLSDTGEARMVDVSGKAVTERTAVAAGSVRMSPEAFDLVRRHAVTKGDVLGIARLAGIMGAKRTADLIPLCHGLPLDDVELTVDLDEELPGVAIRARTKTRARTGVEMEALTAVAIACLTVYDMVKAIDRGMRIEGIRLLAKHGGASDWPATDSPDAASAASI